MNTAKEAGLEMEMEEESTGHDRNHNHVHDSENDAPETILLPEKDDDENIRYSSEDEFANPKHATDKTPKVRGWIWMILSCLATLNGRGILRTGFRELPF